MKTRVITALIGCLLLAVVLVGLYVPFLLETICALVGVIAVYELLKETSYAADPFLYIPAMLMAAWMPFALTFDSLPVLALPYLALLFYYMIVLLKKHETVHFTQICISLFASVILPLAFSSMLVFRDKGNPHGIFYMLAGMFAAWFVDIGGYLVGRKLGKHRLSPKISPKKSVEGAIGGVLTVCLGLPFIGLCYELIYNQFFAVGGETVSLNLPMLALIGLLVSPVGIMGDLFASVIKRQTEIKDFGRIMPGHGGVLDRFDSALWTMGGLAVFLQLGGSFFLS